MTTLGERLAARAETVVQWGDDGLDVGLAEPVPWPDVLALGSGRQGLEATWRNARGGQQRTTFGHVAPAAQAALEAAWRQDQRRRIAAAGGHTGTFVGPPGLPLTWVPTAFAVAGLLIAVVVAALLGLDRVADVLDAGGSLLEPEERSALFLSAVILGSLLSLLVVAAIGTTLAALRVLRLGRRWWSWRIDREGLARRDRDGRWHRLTVVGGDWVSERRAQLGGEIVPLEMLSGGHLTRDLVVGLAERRGVTIRAERRHRWVGLRVAVLYVPVITLAWWALLLSCGHIPGPQELYGAVLCELLALIVAVALWVEDLLLRPGAPRLVAAGREELARLGW